MPKRHRRRDIDSSSVLAPALNREVYSPRRRRAITSLRKAQWLNRENLPSCFACQAAGVFHARRRVALVTGLRAIGHLIRDGSLDDPRMRAPSCSDYGADPDVPLLWRFRKSLSEGASHRHRYPSRLRGAFLVGEIEAVQAYRTFIRASFTGRRCGW